MTNFDGADFGNAPVNAIKVIYLVEDFNGKKYFFVIFKDGGTGHFPWSLANQKAAKATNRLVVPNPSAELPSLTPVQTSVRRAFALMLNGNYKILCELLDGRWVFIQLVPLEVLGWTLGDDASAITIEVDEAGKKTHSAEWLSKDPLKVGQRLKVG